MRSPRPLVLLGLAALAACSAGGPAAPDFTLRDDAGNAWTRSQQRQAMLLDFGFTHCGDTCPLTLSKLERASQQLGARAGDVQIVFVTVDPARDSPPVLHDFLAKFALRGGSRFVGLTGTNAQIAGVERAYRVWAQKMPAKRGSDDYDVMHASTVFFIDARGVQRGLHDDTESPSSLAQAMRSLLQ